MQYISLNELFCKNTTFTVFARLQNTVLDKQFLGMI